MPDNTPDTEGQDSIQDDIQDDIQDEESFDDEVSHELRKQIKIERISLDPTLPPEEKCCTKCLMNKGFSGFPYCLNAKCICHTPPNKQPEAISNKEIARNRLNKVYLRLAYGKSDIATAKQEVDEILTSLLTSQRASDVRRLEGLKVGASRKIDPWSIEVAHIEDVKSYNAGIDQAIALLTDSK